MNARRRDGLVACAILVATSLPMVGMAHALAAISPTEAWITAAIAAVGLLLALDFAFGAPVLTHLACGRGPDGPRKGGSSARTKRTHGRD